MIDLVDSTITIAVFDSSRAIDSQSLSLDRSMGDHSNGEAIGKEVRYLGERLSLRSNLGETAAGRHTKTFMSRYVGTSRSIILVNPQSHNSSK